MAAHFEAQCAPC